MRRRSLLPLLVILMFLFPLLQAGNSPAKGLDGRQVFMEVLEQRRARGITDAEGKAASPLPSTLDRDAYGARVRADLAGQKEIQPPSGVLAFARSSILF